MTTMHMTVPAKKFTKGTNPSHRIKKIYVKLSAVESQRKNIKITIAGCYTTMQIDTGADITLIDRATWERIGFPELKPTNLNVWAANGSKITHYIQLQQL
uniref:Peptidase A2 domain-containing protein n=1 Tax=Heterorhabditis bacteriophora TaxID=37862 RepID=A0A1I7WQN4_HETBA